MKMGDPYRAVDIKYVDGSESQNVHSDEWEMTELGINICRRDSDVVSFIPMSNIKRIDYHVMEI